MNDNHSHIELNYKPRKLAALLIKAAKNHPVLVLTGARQVGKSTLLKNEQPFSDWHYITLDDFENLSLAETSPEALWTTSKYVVIDEVQKAPRILSAVKSAVDSDPARRFVLSGSSNLLLMKQVSESLAGRAVVFRLDPMCISELQSRKHSGILEAALTGSQPEPVKSAPMPPGFDHTTLMWKGLMPPTLSYDATKDPASVLQWWDSYVALYLERDLRQLSQIDSLPDFRRVMQLLALRSGKILNQSDIARDLKLSQPTVHRYINLLEISYMFERLNAFTVNRGKRLVKSPRIMWNDPGLASFLCGYLSPDELSESSMAGGVFESLVYLHLRTAVASLSPKPKIYYWRTTTGREVDFIIEYGRKLLAIEVKMSPSTRYSDTENLRIFLQQYPQAEAALLVYTGNHVKSLDRNITAVPWYLL